MTVEDLSRSWLDHLAVERGLSANTLSNYRRDVQRYVDWLSAVGIDSLQDVTEKHVESYVADLRSGRSCGTPLAASSAGRALVVARGLHRFALAEGAIAVDVTAEISPPATGQHLPDTLSIAEVEKLLTAVGEGESAGPLEIRDRALLELLYGTGARISEVIGLTVDDVAEMDGYIRVRGKGNKERIVPVGGAATEALEAYVVRARPVLATGASHALFLNTRGNTLSRQSAWAVIKSAAQRAGISKDISPHTLRHSYATHLLEGGADVRSVQELLGHSSVTTTQIYTHVTADNLRSVWRESHPRA
ncbi:site-specific tyrosine recombinase XerD [Corynebacterium tapiri]|uniref:Tyrosine recombinase XerD n=1 Tax=Corynebacterium tapiri TaxID=1448266 RepID=A0A5C4U3P3_9CORY|nr:site-specific tyrosine recombinase XerD [Corynebacterium tapiri]TNL97657.1 site-specific tyrosine recombinase XerD [Corynebacterium tapiri]